MKDSRISQNVRIPNDLSGLSALREGASVVDRSERRILRLTGRDPVGMLNAVLTNDVPPEGDRGAYAMLLNPKGRVQTDLRIVKAGDEILVDTEPEGAEAAKEILGRYAPFSRVKLEDLSGSWSVLGLYGPRAGELLGRLELAEHQSREIEIEGRTLLSVGVAAPVFGYDLIGPAETLGTVRGHLIETDATSAGPDTYETARIAAGIPRFGADVTPDNFPGESAVSLERAVSFGKGCYPGQETVARMHYRGSPNKKLYRFELEAGPVPSVDVVGWLTSVAPFPVDGKTYALGYLARKADLDAPLRAEDAKIL